MADGTQPTQAQIARAERSLAILRRRQVPCGPDPLWTEDDDRAELRTPREVARRILVLMAVVQRAEATPPDMVLKNVQRPSLWDAASPSEKRFLQCDVPDEGQSRRLVRRLESVWILTWALGHIEELGWPARQCDVPRLAELLHSKGGTADLVGTARLRPVAEILDAADLNARIARVIRHAHAAGSLVPANLDWARPDALLPVAKCPAASYVGERQLALDWLLRSPDAGWDDRPAG